MTTNMKTKVINFFLSHFVNEHDKTSCVHKEQQLLLMQTYRHMRRDNCELPKFRDIGFRILS
jgi:hypothetical protein